MVKLDTDTIRTRREKLGLTQEQAADAAGFGKGSKQAWWNIENGQRPNLTLDVLAAMARVLECRVRDLIDGDELERKPRRRRAAASAR